MTSSECVRFIQKMVEFPGNQDFDIRMKNMSLSLSHHFYHTLVQMGEVKSK